jgi:hypothetical protein
MKMKIITIAALLGLSTIAQAQDTDHLQAKFGLVLTSLGELKGLTGNANARNFEGGYYMVNAGDLGLDLLAHAGYFRIPAKATTAPALETYTVSSWRFGLDMVWYKGKVANMPVSFRTGPVMSNFWAEGSRVPTTLTNKQWKFGWRAGVDVSITTNWFGTLEATASEWRSDTDYARVQDKNPNHPFYLSLMAGYRF